LQTETSDFPNHSSLKNIFPTETLAIFNSDQKFCLGESTELIFSLANIVDSLSNIQLEEQTIGTCSFLKNK
jgi:hypothetical protein